MGADIPGMQQSLSGASGGGSGNSNVGPGGSIISMIDNAADGDLCPGSGRGNQSDQQQTREPGPTGALPSNEGEGGTISPDRHVNEEALGGEALLVATCSQEGCIRLGWLEMNLQETKATVDGEGSQMEAYLALPSPPDQRSCLSHSRRLPMPF